MTWLETPPLIQFVDWQDARKPFPLSWGEHERHFGRLPRHLREWHCSRSTPARGNRRLRARGVSHETRQVLLGHKNGQITTHYSAAEIGELLEVVEGEPGG